MQLQELVLFKVDWRHWHDVCTNRHEKSLVGLYIIMEELCGETVKMS
jgi:hypothetical protein